MTAVETKLEGKLEDQRKDVFNYRENDKREKDAALKKLTEE